MFSSQSGKWSFSCLCILFVPPLFLFCIGAMTDISVPGIYMDAVNPDYAVVGVLNPASRIESWFLPGTLLFGRWPMLGQIYHGALPFYVGLPFYALFGTGVEGIRLTNMIFGCLVILGAGAFLRAAGVRLLFASLCLMLLALDPEFLFSFRTQFYITLLPIAAVFASAALVDARREAPPRLVVCLAGLFAGLACYGYFIFLFLVPALALLALYRWRDLPRARLLLWPVGFCVGVAPYLIGVIAILSATGGLRGFVTFMRGYLASLQVQHSQLSLLQRMHFFDYLVHGSLLDFGPSLMMLHVMTPLEAPGWKLVLLLLVPALAVLSGIARPRRIAGLLFIAGLLAGFLLLVLVFGNRLWFHHAALLLPVLYAGLALALERLTRCVPTRAAGVAVMICVIAVVPLLIANASDRQAVFLRLEATGGVGLSSDAIDRFAEDALRETDATHVFFPDWGAFMQFAMLTRGSIPYSTDFSPGEAKAMLCSGQDAELVVMAGKADGRLQQWNLALGWPVTTSIYAQRDNKPVLLVERWKAAQRPPGLCPAP
ncbi:hypothetical protein HLH36_04605 [Gluconacetobacter aggeris]|uniref:Glycosyltransferase RgtA/B/C/D-like domain-containing protein n=1 Tax=Gluconacetobacter aggeris TaxID=1286186 RepID=A0A7W4IRH8_9PROT|nr:hypothetical protein [Gluconacetobacter aggeris]MBB2167643.1 hypothetical protein [Gluconacetobacter aggeris]